MKIRGIVTKSCQKPWVLAPTLSKTVGAKAPTAPILMGAMLWVLKYYFFDKELPHYQIRNISCIVFMKIKAKVLLSHF